jgi:2-polyprenyl-6-methoxyphenol hydroxylase-like FAD-dependent oxidoreductase
MNAHEDPPAAVEDIPVLIAGGGLVGLSMAMFLAQHGIASLAIERRRGASSLPRAAFFHMRTLELFRAAGIEERVREQSALDFPPEGALIVMDTLSGKKLADIIPSLNEGVDAVSPCRRLFVTQPGLEPILRARAVEAGAKVLEGSEVTGVEQDARGVTVTARDVDSGAVRRLRGAYLVGADGAHSTVRERLGIPVDGRGVFSNSITIYFTADLSPQLGGKPLSVIYINNPTLGGFFRMSRDCQSGFLAINTVGDPKADPVAAANAAADTSEARLIDLVRAGVGDPKLAVRIDGVARWRATSDVARRYRDGRVFIMGDAAHVMPPNGGFGGNTGIHDAHNLAWKLALVLRGAAGPNLLSTYEAERQPAGRFTVEQAYTRYVTRTAPYLRATDFQPLAHDFNIELGYLYRSAGIAAEDDDPAVHAARGTRRRCLGRGRARGGGPAARARARRPLRGWGSPARSGGELLHGLWPCTVWRSADPAGRLRGMAFAQAGRRSGARAHRRARHRARRLVS